MRIFLINLFYFAPILFVCAFCYPVKKLPSEALRFGIWKRSTNLCVFFPRVKTFIHKLCSFALTIRHEIVESVFIFFLQNRFQTGWNSEEIYSFLSIHNFKYAFFLNEACPVFLNSRCDVYPSKILIFPNPIPIKL